MCEPATLSLIAVGMSTISAGMGALQANAQSQYKAKIAERNAALERDASQQEQENTRQAALARYREIAQVKGRQRLAAAANGVGLDFGTAADVVADTDMLGREDVNRIYQQGNNAVKGRDIQASNYMGEANAARSAGTAALIGGAFDMGSTVLGGVSQFKDMKFKQGWQATRRLTSDAGITIGQNAGIF